MLYEKKTFTVPAVGHKRPEKCEHGWPDAEGNCVLCGEPIKPAVAETKPR